MIILKTKSEFKLFRVIPIYFLSVAYISAFLGNVVGATSLVFTVYISGLKIDMDYENNRNGRRGIVVELNKFLGIYNVYS